MTLASPKKVIYASFHPVKEWFLDLGVARSPVELDHMALHRMNYKYGGLPDILILEEVDAFVDWKPIKFRWKLRLMGLSAWDRAKNDAWNYAKQKANRDELFAGKQFIRAAELLEMREKRRTIRPLT